jgi:pimeloyl-ACP methyl ester carboxylesterase
VRRRVRVGAATVALVDDGDTGACPPVLLLHGCPFSSFVWRGVIARLRDRFQCLAPDLLGLGDTETPPGADWSLPAQAAMVLGLLDALGVEQADVVGHDHGAAVAQLIAASHPDRIRRLVLTNAEAYDNWPSAQERPFLRLVRLPVLGRLALWAWSRPVLFGYALRTGKAVHDPAVLTRELLSGYIAANLADPHRRAKTRRFLRGQLEAANHRATGDAVPGLRAFDHPTLLVWGRDDPHFGLQWAQRLLADIPGAARLEVLPDTGHLLMEERPDDLARQISDFLTAPTTRPAQPLPADQDRAGVNDQTRAEVRAHYAAVATAVLSPSGDTAASQGATAGGAGALSISEYQDGLTAAGFTGVEAVLTHQPADGIHAATLRATKPAGEADDHQHNGG